MSAGCGLRWPAGTSIVMVRDWRDADVGIGVDGHVMHVPMFEIGSSVCTDK